MTSSDPAQESQPLYLEPWQRFTAGLAGAVAIGAGGGAVFVSDNQAGSAALILLGGLAGLLALTGRVPDQIGKEGVSYRPSPAEKTVEALLQSPEPEIRERVAEVYQEKVEDEIRQFPVTATRSTSWMNIAEMKLVTRSEEVLPVLKAALPAGTELLVPGPERADAALLPVGGNRSDGPRVEIFIEGPLFTRRSRPPPPADVRFSEAARPGVAVVHVRQVFGGTSLDRKRDDWFDLYLGDTSEVDSWGVCKDALDQAWAYAASGAGEAAGDL